MLNFDRLVASCATLASRMPLSRAVKLTTSELARLIACCRRFSPAPTTPMTFPRAVLAAVIAVNAAFALAELRMSELLTLADEETAAALLIPIAVLVAAASVCAVKEFELDRTRSPAPLTEAVTNPPAAWLILLTTSLFEAAPARSTVNAFDEPLVSVIVNAAPAARAEETFSAVPPVALLLLFLRPRLEASTRLAVPLRSMLTMLSLLAVPAFAAALPPPMNTFLTTLFDVSLKPEPLPKPMALA